MRGLLCKQNIIKNIFYFILFMFVPFSVEAIRSADLRYFDLFLVILLLEKYNKNIYAKGVILGLLINMNYSYILLIPLVYKNFNKIQIFINVVSAFIFYITSKIIFENKSTLFYFNKITQENFCMVKQKFENIFCDIIFNSSNQWKNTMVGFHKLL